MTCCVDMTVVLDDGQTDLHLASRRQERHGCRSIRMAVGSTHDLLLDRVGRGDGSAKHRLVIVSCPGSRALLAILGPPPSKASGSLQ
jgi:hypothetical protein